MTATQGGVSVIQMGARRNYVYARQLAEHGLLDLLITDAAFVRGSGTLSAWALAKLGATRREITGLDPRRLIASATPNLVSLLRRFMHEETVFALVDEAHALALRARRVPPSRVIVNYCGNGGGYLAYARRRGARILTDFIITPKCLEIVAAEAARWPGWDDEAPPAKVVEAYRRRMERLVALSDFYLCPSQTVARDLADIAGFDPAKVRLTPYGASDVLLTPGETIPGRVLFAGAAGVRKGLPYLAEAARLLRVTDPDLRVVVAGDASAALRARPETQALTFLGHLDRAGMSREFGRADLFCLPSLAEGSATSVYEALAHGVPVVTTASAGSVVTHGLDGLIAPERDGPALAEAIRTLARDRALRARMSAQALATAARYGDEACGARFIEVVREALADAGARASS